MSDVTIRQTWYTQEDGSKGVMAIFETSDCRDPKTILDKAIEEYVCDQEYHELMESSFDNPWVRVIISDINAIGQKIFSPEIHKL